MSERGGADLVLTNAAVQTMDPERPRATAVGGEGRQDRLRRATTPSAKDLSGAGTERIDVGGRTVMPGIHDGHIHALDGGRLLFAPNLQGERLDLNGFLDALARMLEETGDLSRTAG